MRGQSSREIRAALVVGALLIAAYFSKRANEKKNSGPVAPTSEAALGNGTVEKIPSRPWHYGSEPDRMTSRPVVQASTLSTNRVTFEPPYDGGSTGTLAIRSHPRAGTDVIFSVDTGQIVCDVSGGCPVLVRFDASPARRFVGRVPADYSSKALFVQPARTFISRAKLSKRITIEISFYQAGARQYVFNTANLMWPPKKTDY